MAADSPTRKRAAQAVSFLLLLGLLTVEAKVYVVRMGKGRSQEYFPAAITIKTGDRVKFVQKNGPSPHNVKFRAEAPRKRPLGQNPEDDRSFMKGFDAKKYSNLKTFTKNGDSYTTKPFKKPGTFKYICTFHLQCCNMVGTIRVKK